MYANVDLSPLEYLSRKRTRVRMWTQDMDVMQGGAATS